MIRGEGGEPPGRRALTKVASRWLIQKRVRNSLRARPGSSAQPTFERPQPSKPRDPGRRLGQGGRGRERGREPGSLPGFRGAGQGRSPLARSERYSSRLRLLLLCRSASFFPFPGPGLAELAAEPSFRPVSLNKSSRLAQLWSPTWSRPATSESSPLTRAPGCFGFPSH